MLVSELKELLSDYPDHLEVRIATDRYTGPFQTGVRGIVLKTEYGPVFLVGDYHAKTLTIDPWEELDG
jgi:hypothetical protein